MPLQPHEETKDSETQKQLASSCQTRIQATKKIIRSQQQFVFNSFNRWPFWDVQKNTTDSSCQLAAPKKSPWRRPRSWRWKRLRWWRWMEDVGWSFDIYGRLVNIHKSWMMDSCFFFKLESRGLFSYSWNILEYLHAVHPWNLTCWT